MEEKLALSIVYMGKATSLLHRKVVRPITITIRGFDALVNLDDREFELSVIDELGTIFLAPKNSANGMQVSFEKTSSGKKHDGRYSCLNYLDVGLIQIERTVIGDLIFFRQLINSSKL